MLELVCGDRRPHHSAGSTQSFNSNACTARKTVPSLGLAACAYCNSKIILQNIRIERNVIQSAGSGDDA